MSIFLLFLSEFSIFYFHRRQLKTAQFKMAFKQLVEVL